MAIHSSIFAWRIPGTEKFGGLQPMELQRVGHNGVTEHSTRLFNDPSMWHNTQAIDKHLGSPSLTSPPLLLLLQKG